jgi:hypothetical protein
MLLVRPLPLLRCSVMPSVHHPLLVSRRTTKPRTIQNSNALSHSRLRLVAAVLSLSPLPCLLLTAPFRCCVFLGTKAKVADVVPRRTGRPKQPTNRFRFDAVARSRRRNLQRERKESKSNSDDDEPQQPEEPAVSKPGRGRPRKDRKHESNVKRRLWKKQQRIQLFSQCLGSSLPLLTLALAG